MEIFQKLLPDFIRDPTLKSLNFREFVIDDKFLEMPLN